MSHFASLSRIGFGTGLLLALASACGGQSFAPGGGDAGSAQGGTTSEAGTSNVAGKGHAGRGSGGSGNVGGTVSSGGSSVGGSVGTGGSGPIDYTTCNLPSDCAIRGTGCCGVCDAPNLSEKDFIAFNKMYGSMFQCGVPLPAAPAADPATGGSASAGAAAPIACAPCIGLPPGQGSLMYFVPDCIKNQCVVEDLRTSPVTACKASDECKVRSGAYCCEGCSAGQDFAVRNDGSFEKLVCGDGPVGCLACVPPESGAVPVCEGGRCAAVYPLK